MGATGCADLDESELALILRVFLQEALDATKTFKDTLGVVDAIDTDSDVERLDTKFRST